MDVLAPERRGRGRERRQGEGTARQGPAFCVHYGATPLSSVAGFLSLTVWVPL